MAEPIYKVPCPACGAPVSFMSSASVMAVCSYCQSTLLRDADSVRNIGKMSDILADYSPIQIGTSGVYEGSAFSVVGRIQLQYEDGYWNEWYAVFDDGSTGWLADASGQYVFTRDAPAPASGPTFDALRPGNGVPHLDHLWNVADVRVAHCIAGQGELPFAVGAGYAVKAADLRYRDRFMTLDWSEPTLRCYVGKAVTLDGMKCQLLREGSAIADTAGRLRGKISSLNCPACGSPIQYAPGLTRFMVCPACHAESAQSPDKQEVLATQERVNARPTTLKPGDSGNIDGVLWDVLGVMVKREVGENAFWTEYLLFNVIKGFLWLVESDEGWQRVQVLDVWPSPAGNAITWETATFAHQYQYTGEVVWAAGSFNWRVKTGDRVVVNDYRQGQITLTSEATAEEMTWSRSQPVSAEQLQKWFTHASFKAAAATTRPGAGGIELETLAKVFTGGMVLLNIPALLNADDSGGPIFISAIAILLLWLPIWAWRKT
ncbi:endogenous inhibitor of DNA gyrase (YacG/DUF329 family) [Silvimonas terrae]|uniref:Endogenous inhibitor of DNA gyrase (YacG/DUF329 family) n=1 Tax=Silvimonas terrae TaxID=300266 RepID=A0A840RGT9_9NEIS|nr:DUF4178 domain-containing protein [Silvimonas terrae]MBB5192267.1 endogenous inhibitor of DNA gyrase (YacG/DUF329 family) [Silvimonas terrae]